LKLNKLLSGRNRPDNNANCGVIYKSIDQAKKSEIHRTFRLLGGSAWYTMSINHRRSHIGMTQHGLDRPNIVIDELVKSRKTVTPAKAGVHNLLECLDSRFRGNDKKGAKRTFYESINILPLFSRMSEANLFLVNRQ
jgi:hypothetical protein